MLAEEAAPLGRQLGAVGLDRVLDDGARPTMLFDESRPRAGKSPAPSTSARRPARRPRPGVPAGTRAAAGCRFRADRRPSGTGRPGRASPSTGRSSTCSRDCKSAPSALPARGSGAAYSPDGRDRLSVPWLSALASSKAKGRPAPDCPMSARFSPRNAVCHNPSPKKRAGLTICCEPRSACRRRDSRRFRLGARSHQAIDQTADEQVRHAREEKCDE